MSMEEYYRIVDLGWDIFYACNGEYENSDCEYIAECLINNGLMVQKWIPVTEHKPKKMNQYIVMLEGATSSTALYYAPMMDFWFENAEEFSEKKQVHNVTHWMYMPKLPRGE